MRLTTRAAALALATALAGCGAVKVVPSGSGVTAAPRPADCPLEFLSKAPPRSYDELAELSSQVSSPPRAGAQEALRESACRLGADAVIVTRNFVMNAYGHTLVAGTAIKYRAGEAAPEPEQVAPGAPAPEQPAPAPRPEPRTPPATPGPGVDL
ncbi:MAG TPA: hypothetical protein VFE30_06970 [Anaeromyxobacteraceae bacterium]|jgi:hypothetical protein|nr:hypothetical protein [Anaeromyxobacteraceae bacterium]